MIGLGRRPAASEPPLITDKAEAGSRSPYRLLVSDPEPVFFPHPLFADKAHYSWFFAKSWNHIKPPAGVQQFGSIVRREFDKFLLLHRYGEGVIFDAEGTSNSPGFLNNMLTMPPGMSHDGAQFVVEPSVLAAAPHLEGAWLIFYNGNLQNYYHWLVEGMLALHILDANPLSASKTILPASLPGQVNFDHTEFFRYLGHDRLRIARVSAPYVHVDEVFHVEEGGMDSYPIFAMQSFRSKVVKRYGSGEKHKIFIVRPSLRSVINQAELDAVLAPAGFRAYTLEDMSLERQLRLFANAEFIVAPHGAGLSNLLFAPAGCKVIELMPCCEMRPFFWQIGAKLQFSYGMLPCPTEGDRFNGRLTVDMELFRALLSMVTLQR